MKIILLKPVERLGKPFDIVSVKDGYARNYLFRRNLAISATEANIQGLEKNKKRFSKKIEKIKKMSMGLAEQINSTSIKTTIKTGIEGKSFGSITSHDLAELLKSEGFEIDKKNIVLDEPIKHPGVYDIKVHLGENIDATFKFILLEEGA
ncbi:50S ribosomal protein L9 [candidate division WOR-3 bacterium]|jgi:large subunit ribosomal protein L9|nr:50S ribosomal protein L9 [candidate division WOR-3 bacterium]